MSGLSCKSLSPQVSILSEMFISLEGLEKQCNKVKLNYYGSLGISDSMGK